VTSSRDIRFEDFVVVSINNVVYWSVTPYSLVSVYQCFGGIFYFLEEEGSTFYSTGPVLMLGYYFFSICCLYFVISLKQSPEHLKTSACGISVKCSCINYHLSMPF
jgi:hypothetical protein